MGHRTEDHESDQLLSEEDDNLTDGHIDERHRRRREGAPSEPSISFRNPPEGTEYLPALSAPVGHRSILAEVRAGVPSRLPMQQIRENGSGRSRAGSGSGRGGYSGVGGREGRGENGRDVVGRVPTRPRGHAMEGGSGGGGRGKAFLTGARSRGETMSRGNVNGGTGGNMDAFTWLSKVKVGGRGDGYLGSGNGGLGHSMVGEVGGGAVEGRAASSGPPTPGEESGSLSSRHNSRSRQVSGADLAGMEERWRERESKSRVRGRGDEQERAVEKKDSLESGIRQAQSLQDE